MRELSDQRGRPGYSALLAVLKDHKIDTSLLDRVVGETQMDMLEAGYLSLPVYTSIVDKCYYCLGKADGAMLIMDGQMAHATCVIRELNKLLDPDYDGRGVPSTIVGFLAGYVLPRKDYVRLAEDQSLPENPYPTDYDELPFEFQEDNPTCEDVYLMTSNGFEKGMSHMLKAGWRKVLPILEGLEEKE